MSEDGFDANASQNSQSGGIFGTNNNDSKNNAVSSPSKLTKSKLDHIHHDNLSAMSGRDGEDTSSNYSAGGSPMPSALKKKGKTGKDRARKKASFAGDSDDDRDSAASSNMDGDADGDSGKKNDDAASHDSAAYNTKRQELLERERQMNRAAMTKKMSSSAKTSGAAASNGGSGGGGSGSSGGDDSGNDGGASGPGRAIPTRYLSARISNWCARCVPDLLASCSPTTMMICLFLIPVFFLIAYTAVPLAEAILSDDYLQAQRGLIVKILDAAGKAQAERRDSSLFLVAPTNTTAERSAIAILTSTRQTVDSALSNVLTTVATSGSGANANQYAGDVLLQTQAIISFYAAERRLVDTRTVSNVQMNSDLLLGVENIYSLVLLIAKDSKASKIQNSFTIFVLLGRIQNSFSILRSMGVGVLSSNGVYAENVQQMFAARQAKDRDLLIVQNAGDPSAIMHLNSWQNSTEYKAFYNTVSDLISGDPTKIFNHTVASWVATANTFVRILQVQDEILLAKVASGDSLHATAIAEGMMMMGAVLACLFAGLFVIWYNGKEQEKLEGALMSTRMLARAVQRFVPKNQLRIMGVRSIIEVQPGMSTEVASVLLTAGIRNFSDLAKMMNNTDLFDWIQKYMSRMTHVTQNNSGYIDKVIADTAYAVFSVSKNAVQSAIAMQVVTDQLNAVLVAQGHDHHVTIGIGIHLCPVVTGVYGDGNRLNVAMVSNDVMLASRLEAMTKSFGAKILASDAVVSQIAVANPVIIKKRHHHHNSKQKKEALRKKREMLAKMNRNSDSEGHPATPGGADASADTSQDRSSRTLDSSTGSSGTDSSNGGDDDGQQQQGGSRTGTTGFQLRLVGSVKRIVQAGSTLGSSHISSSESASFSQTVDGADVKKGIFEKTKSERDVGTPHNRNSNNNNSSDGSSSDLHTASTGGSSSTVALTDIYDIFQADDLVVKQFKVETRRDFEKAIRIVLKDGESKQAKDMLMRLHRKAKNRGIRDVAVDRTIRALRANISENALVICEQAERDVEDMRGGVDDDSPGFGKRNKNNNNYSRNRTSNNSNNNNSSKNLTGSGGGNSIPALKNSFRSTNSNNNSKNAINSTNNNESNDEDEDDEEKYQQELNRRRQQRARREQNEQQQQRRKQNDEEEKQEEEEEVSSEPSDSRYKPQHVYIPPKHNKNRFSPTNNESSGSPRNPHYIPSSEDENNANKNHNNSDELVSPNRRKMYQSEKREETSSRTAPPSSIDRTAENVETASSAAAASSPTSKQRQLKKSSELTDKNNNNAESTPPSVDALLAQNTKGNDRRNAKKNDTNNSNNSDDHAVDNETTGKPFSIRDNNNITKNIDNGHSGSTNIGMLPKGKPVPTAAEHNAREQQKQENGGDVPKQ